jgi:hypothetical protein
MLACLAAAGIAVTAKGDMFTNGLFGCFSAGRLFVWKLESPELKP